MPPASPRGAVGSYPTFSPLPRQVEEVYFLLHFLSLIPKCLPVRKHAVLCCPDFPLRIPEAMKQFALQK